MNAITLLVVVVCMCGVGVTAEWFPKMELSEKEWQSALSSFDVGASYKTCTTEHKSTSGDNRYITLYKDVPMTYVIVGSGSGNLDIKFKDSNYVFEHKFELSKDKYLIIPPYQPVEWIYMRLGEGYKLCSYSGSIGPEDTVQHASECDCSDVVASASKFSSVNFPHTIRKPEQQFFLTADITPDPNDVTICTILTVDRLLRIQQMSEMWGGPISAAVYLHDLSEISTVMEWYLANNTMRRHVDIHLVQDDKLIAFELPDRAFPVNILRNVAIRFARTSNVFYIEGDFIPSLDLYPNLGPIRERLAKGEKSVFIVAPFSTDNAEFDMKLFPKDKEALQIMIKDHGPIRDLSYFNSHAAFKFNDWFKATSIYPMTFAGGYEPYYIGPKSYPLFEEIFIGCGADKVEHPSELNSAGYKFYVVPTGFIVHIDSTGMGSAWCRGWAGNARSSMKWEAFTIKTGHIYSNRAKGSYDSRVPWWDLAPVVQKAIGSGKEEEETCAAQPPKQQECPKCPTPKECKECPECPVKPGCPPPTKSECARFTESYEAEVNSLKNQITKFEETTSQRKNTIMKLEEMVAELRTQNDDLEEYAKFVVNLSIGVVVVMVVVVGVGICIWPRNKKVWVLPTWKPNHRNL